MLQMGSDLAIDPMDGMMIDMDGEMSGGGMNHPTSNQGIHDHREVTDQDDFNDNSPTQIDQNQLAEA